MAKSSDLRSAILGRAGPGALARRGPVSAPAEPDAEPIGSRRQASRVGKVSICGFFAPEARRQLRRLAVDTDTTIQALLGEALNDLFAKHGLPELADSGSTDR